MRSGPRWLGFLLSLLLTAELPACEALAWKNATATPARTPASSATPTSEVVTEPPKNPLTGLEVPDLSLLKMPALLISISHFPATARPQAGLSFAPFVYEFYITEGATRFLAVFHGEWPAPEIAVNGGCQARVGPFEQSATLLGNRVWLDADSDGVQDAGEQGIAGLCVNLLDQSGQVIASTSSDTNGYYGFNVQPGKYVLEFVVPGWLKLARADTTEDDLDSDPNPFTGRVDVLVANDDLDVDAGLSPSAEGNSGAATDTRMPLAQVGPIRSGRLLYRHLARTFPNSCLIYAYASPEVLSRLPQCAVVFHQIQGGGYMLDLSELLKVAKKNQRLSTGESDYSTYEFSPRPLGAGAEASALRVYFSYQNQSGWFYDTLSESYLRYVDTSEREKAGILHPETDRLTGRQLAVQNLIVMFARHDVISPTNLDIRLDAGKTGKAMLFRDGEALSIDWVNPRDDQPGAGRPIEFLQKNGKPAPLKPGHTWVLIVTPESALQSASESGWRLTYVPPEGAK